MFKYGIEIHPGAQIGRGLYIGHWVGIVISPRAVIGENCYISHGVTIGMINSGNNAGVPVIGDRVYIGAGAKIIGNIKIGNDVAIGSNAVVTKDVPDGVTVGGVPAK
ncbi:MAG: serine acetyltransferase, partial [Epsilonproteobacteria bacterium]|nr:serine acetyltransferase [Campylobacterota bacterium]